MISPCYSDGKGLNFSACSPSLAGCSTPKSSRGHSKLLRAGGYRGTTEKQQRVQKTVLSVSEGAESKDTCDNDSGVIRDTEESTGHEHIVSCDSAADNLQSQRLQCEDESQAFNVRRHRKKRKNVKSSDCRSYVDSSPLSERDGMRSTSGIDTEVHHEPDVEPPLGSDLSLSLSPSYSMCDTVDVSQCERHAVREAAAGCAESELDTGGMQLTNAQDVEHQHQVDLLTEDSIHSELSDEDCVSAAEQTGFSAKSATSVAVTADVHAPASPPLYSTDEEDGVCSESSQGEQESAEETEEVYSFQV